MQTVFQWLVTYLLPQKSLTQIAGYLANLKGGALTTAVVRRFIRHYRVQMDDALAPDPASYETFNAFFTRVLRPGCRPIATAPWVCPVDGTISQLGVIEQGQIFQAKGHRYSVAALLGDTSLGSTQDLFKNSRFHNGQFATVYLSPKDYHRIHMPCHGVLERMVYVPGKLFSVNPATAQTVPGLFARNERVVCHFATAHGPLVMVLVGATIVGSMATVWHGVVNPPRRAQITEWAYPSSPPVSLEQGEEMGRFLLGSTVIVLWPEGAAELNANLKPGHAVRMGQALAAVLS
jgi:phosphatidylserine decarboxylase